LFLTTLFACVCASPYRQVEPLYGKQYLPRKFKVGITVPGDNSIDIYISDIGLVVITDPNNNDGAFVLWHSVHDSTYVCCSRSLGQGETFTLIFFCALCFSIRLVLSLASRFR